MKLTYILHRYVILCLGAVNGANIYRFFLNLLECTYLEIGTSSQGRLLIEYR